ncbi:MAG: TetR family transcriptional regulator [Caulobacterales bacterium 32-67-6]|nr:MAG: TetR family transcriptional regulator [Caulobacterales bacterium 32-67-6]
MATKPRWRRQKETRPGDIVRAALDVFTEKGFAGARMEEIAARAGVSKGAPYLYFQTKEDLFAAVVREAFEPKLEPVLALIASHEGALEPLLRAMTQHGAHLAATTQLGQVMKLVISESRTFPEIARIWHDNLLARGLDALTSLIERAQQRGEIRPGDPRLHALSLIAPLPVGVIFRETFVPTGAKPFDLAALMNQHLDTVLPGLLTKESST